MASWAAVCLAGASLPGFAFDATASIEGRVFHSSTGAPLRKASVRLVRTDRPQGGGRGGGPLQSIRETDEQGRFAFTGLEAGRYGLSADRQGFLHQAYGAHKYSSATTPLILTEGQNMRDVMFKMVPQSVIVGRILDEEGDPVANVQVRAWKQGYRDGHKEWVVAGQTSSNDIGEYRVAYLDPGRYLVSTFQAGRSFLNQAAPDPSQPDAPEMRFAPTYYPNAPEQTAAAPVDVGPGGEVRGIDVRLRKARTFRIRGRVESAGERGFAAVQLLSATGEQTVPINAPARPPEGRFELAGIAPGSYVLYAQVGGRGQQSVAYLPVEVRGQNVDGIVLKMAAGAAIQGTLKVADGNPSAPPDLTRVNINLRPALAMVNAPRTRGVEGGQFTLNNVLPLHYTVAVTGLPETCYVESIRYGNRDVPASGFDFVAGGALEITVNAKAGQLAVTALDRDGKPMPSATVAIVPPDGLPVRGLTTDENGAASFASLKPGSYLVLAWEDIPQGAWMDPEFIRKYEGTGQTVKIDAAAKQSIQTKALALE